MRTLLLSAAVSMAIALLGTPVAIRFFVRHGVGQEIQDELAAAGHASKRGTPTMGGIVIILASLVGYLAGHLITADPMTVSGLLVLFLMTGMGLVGFVDDFIKVFRQRSLGLRAGRKLAGQIVVGAAFGIIALRFPNGYDLTPASDHLSFLTDFGIAIGPVFFVIWVILMTGGASNGVNLVDGLDGLATGACIPVLAAYVIIGNWQLRNECTTTLVQNCYDVRDPLDLAVVAGAVLGACFGFLWWNAPPAKIFMGDVGALGLGGRRAAAAPERAGVVDDQAGSTGTSSNATEPLTVTAAPSRSSPMSRRTAGGVAADERAAPFRPVPPAAGRPPRSPRRRPARA